MAKRTTTRTTPSSTSGAEVVPVGRGGLGSHVVSHVVSKSLPYVAPWISAAVLPPSAGLAINQLWGDTPLSAGLASAALAVGGAGLGAVTWKSTPASSAWGRARRAQATASVAAGAGWLTCAVSAGPFGHPMLDAWLIGGALFAASWNLRQLTRNGAAAEAGGEEGGGGLDSLRQAIGWEKIRVRSADGTGKGTVRAGLELTGAATVPDAQATTGRLASALRLPPSAVTITGDPEDSSRATASLRVVDRLKDGVPFTVPDALGMLPTHPIPLGMYADGEPWVIDPFGAAILQHVLVMGVTGAGKSEVLRGLIAHLATRRKMSVFVIDTGKGMQTVGHLREGIDWLVSDVKEAKRLLRALPAAIKARTDVLAAEGADRWTPDSSLNAVMLWIEEAADLADFSEIEEIARKARSAGIWLGISLQRATWGNVSTDVRANLQASICLGVDDPADAGFCLPDRVTDAGAVPAWGVDRPGYLYSTGMGIPADRYTMEIRSALTDRDELAQLVAWGTLYRDPLDETTATALGAVYAQRPQRGSNNHTPAPGAPNAAPAAPAPAPAPHGAASLPTPHPTDEAEPMTAAEEAAAAEIESVREDVLGAIPPDPEPDAPYASLDLEDDVPEPDAEGGIEFDAPAPIGAEEARYILCAELDGWYQTGRYEFEPSDLIPATTAAGRKRPWLQGQLKAMCEAGVIRRDGHGAYTLLHSPLQPV
ncbi:FtsK/SpoIIIE domain-containing protein [Streptomyces sp. DSM 41982]|uniref:FtsK/SpoIIIE domain-containing protein n=1 Tax=Streptomyces evansiae TaxID=3075535 RepID=A0ABD5EBP8_9ACTN|nr:MULTISPECIES: FtsK/SpoIIIE domain-containing protein [unclassified Streptomyces]MDT0418861.1 FtsK/SpoIIIE domain-containing protein [Streptomyces sp. DSM 41982]SCD62339.1 FtsK/SpoIIIE family protein [Streptomyces sp. SolWspMP-sol7th]